MTNLTRNFAIALLLTFVVFSCDQPSGEQQAAGTAKKSKEVADDRFQYVTLQGDSVFSPQEPSEKALQQFEEAKNRYENNTDSAEFLIWYGRRAAYIGRYKTAIDAFTRGIGKFPDDPRFYRHRGHRFITTRRYSAAIADFEKATQLIEGAEDVKEPDGIPNKLNQPVSTLQSNIWYHLGLAYYLENDLRNALRSYRECAKVSKNDDMVVSTSHWLYMTLRRMNEKAQADEVLKDIDSEMTIIENDSYHQLCLFYKGELSEEDINGTEGGDPSNDGTLYGLANWHLYNDNRDQAREYYEKILKNGNKASFGYIAAESDYLREFK